MDPPSAWIANGEDLKARSFQKLVTLEKRKACGFEYGSNFFWGRADAASIALQRPPFVSKGRPASVTVLSVGTEIVTCCGRPRVSVIA